MVDKNVTYCSKDRLSCAKCVPSDVILCLKSDDLVNPFSCGEAEGETPFLLSYIDAELTNVSKYPGGCGTTQYKYTFTYNDEDLVSTDVPIQTSDIAGVFCKGCLHSWVEAKVGNEITLVDNEDGTLTLTTQHGCQYTFNGEMP